MNLRTNTIKISLIAALVAVITLLHYGALHGHLELHLLHRELYFIPILLASFWFGLKFGLATSLIISLIYAPHVVVYDDPHGAFLTVITQILVFNLVAILLGWLVDRQKRQQQEMLAVQNLTVLGRAAAAVGHEINDILSALKRLTQPANDLNKDLGSDFKQEVARLEKMAQVLSSFVPYEQYEQVELISRDLNRIIQDQVENLQKTARKAGVALEARLDENGCPSSPDTGKIGWVLGHLIKNAMEVSGPGQTIRVRSHRGGSHCQVEVQDQGPGIRPEHLSKIFTPFFTTKEKGHGLALAVCKKILRDLGGDIQFESQWGEGATFTLIVPREDLGEQALSSRKKAEI